MVKIEEKNRDCCNTVSNRAKKSATKTGKKDNTEREKEKKCNVKSITISLCSTTFFIYITFFPLYLTKS